ncbi:hypothetical protein ACWC09_26555 [Streptomyces sp. NPDC001617]
MTDTTTESPASAALIAAKVHAQNSWYTFTGQKGYKALVPSWRVGDTDDGSPLLSSEVVGPGAAYALARFARDYYLNLPHPGDVRPQFDIDAPAGRTVLAWRYDGVWVELWHSDGVTDVPEAPQPVHTAPVPVQAAPKAPTPVAPAGKPRRPLLGPGGRLVFTRNRRNLDKETSTS